MVSVGAKPAALTDCLCFGNPEKPEQMHDIVEAIRGIKEACEAVPLYDYRDSPTPIISGNVSLYNESENRAIPASPIISCLGVIEDIDFAMTPHFKKVDSHLLLLSHNQKVADEFFAVLDLARAKALLSCQMIDLGGIAFALMSMSFKNSIGFAVSGDLDLFSEAGGFILEVAADKLSEVTTLLTHKKVQFQEIGHTRAEPKLIFDKINLDLAQAKTIFTNSLRDLRS